MKRIFHLFFMVFAGIYLVSLVGCSKDDTGEVADSVLVLSADKQGIIADGRDTVHLSVTNEQNVNITPQCQFVINGIKQDKAFFVTTKAGSFDIMAEYSSVYSNKVTVGAELPDIASFKLEGDKTKLFPDGADLVRLKLVTKSGTDITSRARFYANGTELPDRYFSTKASGTTTISVDYQGDKVPVTLTVVANEQNLFVDRVLIEMLTGTWCGNCAPFVITLDQAVYGYRDKNGVDHPGEERYIPIMIHGKDKYEKLPEADQIYDLFEASGYPTLKLDRDRAPVVGLLKDVLKGSLLAESLVGIAINTRKEGNEVVVDSKFRGKENMDNSKYVVALVEEGIFDTQVSVNGSIEHHAILRQTTSVTGTPVEISQGQVVTRTNRLALTGCVNVSNCKVVVYVLNKDGKVPNVQQIRLGEQIGY